MEFTQTIDTCGLDCTLDDIFSGLKELRQVDEREERRQQHIKPIFNERETEILQSRGFKNYSDFYTLRGLSELEVIMLFNDISYTSALKIYDYVAGLPE